MDTEKSQAVRSSSAAQMRSKSRARMPRMASSPTGKLAARKEKKAPNNDRSKSTAANVPKFESWKHGMCKTLLRDEPESAPGKDGVQTLMERVQGKLESSIAQASQAEQSFRSAETVAYNSPVWDDEPLGRRRIITETTSRDLLVKILVTIESSITNLEDLHETHALMNICLRSRVDEEWPSRALHILDGTN